MSNVTIDLDVITAELNDIKSEIARANFTLKQLQKEEEKRELMLIAFLSQRGVNEAEHGIYRFGLKTTTRRALDQQLLKEKYNDIYEECKTEKENQKFVFGVIQ